jgi:hypothetical protein
VKPTLPASNPPFITRLARAGEMKPAAAVAINAIVAIIRLFIVFPPLSRRSSGNGGLPKGSRPLTYSNFYTSLGFYSISRACRSRVPVARKICVNPDTSTRVFRCLCRAKKLAAPHSLPLWRRQQGRRIPLFSSRRPEIRRRRARGAGSASAAEDRPVSGFLRMSAFFTPACGRATRIQEHRLW